MILALMALLAAGPMEEGFLALFNGKDLSEWTFFFEKVGPNKDSTINGEPVNEFKGIPEVPGHVLFRIEGGTFEVRDLRIKELK